jgi:hypothetical protein
MCQKYRSASQITMKVIGFANAPSFFSTLCRRRVAGRMITRESDSSRSSGAMSPSRMCWVMCIENRYCSPSASMGETSAISSTIRKAANAPA